MPKANKKPLTVSVIVPCYNEEGNVKSCIERTAKTNPKYEIVVVDDGSKDNTLKIANFLKKKYPQLKVISYVPNGGKGFAVNTGLNAAKGQILVILDADMTIRPEDLPKAIAPIQNNQADFVNVTRFKLSMEDKAMKGLNNFGNRMMAVLFSWVLKQKITDTLCGTKVFLKSDFLKFGIDPDDSWGDFSMLFGAARLHLRFTEVPLRYYARVSGTSKMKFIKHSYKMLKVFFKLLSRQ